MFVFVIYESNKKNDLISDPKQTPGVYQERKRSVTCGHTSKEREYMSGQAPRAEWERVEEQASRLQCTTLAASENMQCNTSFLFLKTSQSLQFTCADVLRAYT